jgi:MoxR-like ATPase
MASTSVIFTTAPVLVARSADREDRSRKTTAGPGTILTLAAYYLATTQTDPGRHDRRPTATRRQATALEPRGRPMSNIQQTGDKVLANVERVIVGKHQEVRLALVALLCRGHLLIEDVPGTGKTMLAKAIARSLGGSFRRIQFTPDLLPSDVSGLSIYNQKTQEFEFRPGPIFSQVVLADEINRATPKTQSALLECMEERQATIDGTTYPMPDPFLVIATQNPIEYEGTFALPEAQLDRFMLRLRLGYPQPIEEIVILDEQKRTHPLEDLEEVLAIEDLREMQAAVRETYVDSTVSDYIVRLVNGTRNHPDIYLGASPRGSIALYRAGQALAGLLGRDYVIPDDIKALAEPALAHRLIIKTSSSIHDVQAGQVVRELLESTAIDGIRPTGGGPTGLRAAGPAASTASSS